MSRTTENYVFIDKKLDENNNLKKIEVYGNLKELWRNEKIHLKNSIEAATISQLRRAIKNNRYEDENISIKKCEVQRSKYNKK